LGIVSSSVRSSPRLVVAKHRTGGAFRVPALAKIQILLYFNVLNNNKYAVLTFPRTFMQQSCFTVAKNDYTAKGEKGAVSAACFRGAAIVRAQRAQP
jgi:hypothetical protein